MSASPVGINSLGTEAELEGKKGAQLSRCASSTAAVFFGPLKVAQVPPLFLIGAVPISAVIPGMNRNCVPPVGALGGANCAAGLRALEGWPQATELVLPSRLAGSGSHLPSERNCAHPGMTLHLHSNHIPARAAVKSRSPKRDGGDGNVAAAITVLFSDDSTLKFVGR